MHKAAPQLNGDLNLELDEHLVKMACEGQSIRLTFASFKGLRKFMSFYKDIKKKWQPYISSDSINQFKLSYYLSDYFIGESHADLKPSWIGRYFGLEKTKIYPRQLFKYFFSSKP